MKLLRLLCCAAVVSFAAPGFADEEKEKPEGKALKGTYERTVGDFTLSFTFKKENVVTMKMISGTGEGFTFDADYKKGDAGKTTITVKKVKPIEGGGGPNEGSEYGFNLKFEGKTMTLSDLKGEGAEEVAQLVEGKYTLKDD